VTCANKADPIEMLFEVWIPVDPVNHVLDGGAHWRHLVNNTIEPSVCGRDAALSEIILTTYYYGQIFLECRTL